jgi:hypothetical protein
LNINPRGNDVTKKVSSLPTSRHVDALIHQVFVHPVLMTGRGPFCRGLDIPAYTASIGATLDLKDKILEDWSWNVKADNGEGRASMNKGGARSGPALSFNDTSDERAAALCGVLLQAVGMDNQWNALSPKAAKSLMGLFADISSREDHDFCVSITLEDVLNDLTGAVRLSQLASKASIA